MFKHYVILDRLEDIREWVSVPEHRGQLLTDHKGQHRVVIRDWGTPVSGLFEAEFGVSIRLEPFPE